jgi:hypothetical protein
MMMMIVAMMMQDDDNGDDDSNNLHIHHQPSTHQPTYSSMHQGLKIKRWEV